MRNLIVFFLLSILSFGQVPQGMSHRGTVYNTNGTIVSNTLVSISIRILDGSSSGTEVYKELHTNIQTNNNGQYSLVIGQGNPQNGTFDAIDWSTGNKFLEIAIDPTSGTGTNYSLVGSSQLMSVPYALFAGKSDSSIEVLGTIQDLKNYSFLEDKKIVYVKGYYNEGDGGGGTFIYQVSGTNSTAQSQVEPANDGTIFESLSNNSSTDGRWFRLYEGFLNILFFGVVKDSYPSNVPQNFSNSDRIQSAINYVTGTNNKIYNKNLNKVLVFPDGLYFIDKSIYLKDKLNIMGASGTLLQITDDFSGDYMFELDSGPVTSLKMEGFILNLNEKVGVGGMHIKGNANPTGGLWTSTLKNIDIINLQGNGIYLEGGDAGNDTTPDSNYNAPNQFNIFESINIGRKNSNYYSLKITGQNANYNFINCQFVTDPNLGIDGACIYIASINSGTSFNKIASEALSFINCGFGGVTRYGAIIKDSGNITFDTCFFEALDISFEISDSRQISILNSRFANAAGMGTRNGSYTNHVGSCVHMTKSSVTLEGNYVIVTDPSSSLLENQSFLISDNTSSTVNLSRNVFQTQELSKTFGIMQLVNIVNNAVDLYGKKVVFITVPSGSVASSNQINRINSTVGPGEVIFLRANQGSITFNDMVDGTNGKNIFLSGRTSLILNNGQAATFIKIDNIVGNEDCTYQLVSISN